MARVINLENALDRLTLRVENLESAVYGNKKEPVPAKWEDVETEYEETEEDAETTEE